MRSMNSRYRTGCVASTLFLPSRPKKTGYIRVVSAYAGYACNLQPAERMDVATDLRIRTYADPLENI